MIVLRAASAPFAGRLNIFLFSVLSLKECQCGAAHNSKSYL